MSATTDFPIQNLPSACFVARRQRRGVSRRRRDRRSDPRSRAARGERRAACRVALAGEALAAAAQAATECLHGAGTERLDRAAPARSRVRCAPARRAARLSCICAHAAALTRSSRCRRRSATTPISIRSIHHATAVGRLLRPGQPLLPNYQWMPIAYHGRASSIGVSGQPFARPWARSCLRAISSAPVLAAERAARLSSSNSASSSAPAMRSGTPIAHRSKPRIARVWSVPAQRLVGARHAGLGVSAARPVPRQELRHHDLALDRHARGAGALSRALDAARRPIPQPLPYLDSPGTARRGRVRHRARGGARDRSHARTPASRPSGSSRTNFRHAYWSSRRWSRITPSTAAICAARRSARYRHAVGPSAEEAGSLLELSVGGKQPLMLPNGETRTFLEDGDAVILRGWCERAGRARIGFGEASGTGAAAD